ncbi:thermonuclease family protein [Priestia megaterium]
MTALQISDNYIRKGTVKKVRDGDTLELLIDTGYQNYTYQAIRLKGINCSDKTLKQELSKLMAQKAKDYVIDKVLNKEVYVESYKFAERSFDRYVGIIYYQQEDGWINLNQELLDTGLAKVYFKGASKVEWEDQ